jgi:hypothetical protein
MQSLRTIAALTLAFMTVASHNPLAAAAPSQAASAYQLVDFFGLANYVYNPKDAFNPTPLPAVGTIPGWITALNGKKIRIRGNSMAVDFSEGMMSEFILAVSQDVCGFGAIPRINEWIYVTMVGGKKAKVITGGDMVVNGTFTVKEDLVKGRLIGLYSLDADSVVQ